MAFAWLKNGRRAWRDGVLAGVCAFSAAIPQASAAVVDIQFDYTYDSSNFFNGNAQRQNLLNAAAQVFESRFTDNLTAITPGSGNTWSAVFSHPVTGLDQIVDNLAIASGVIKVYVGARNLGGSTLGEGGPGGFGASGSQAFIDNISLRGQLSGTTDFGPWGGSISFDADTSWYFDNDISTLESFGSMSDFYSVAVHELAHLLGFGTAPSWDNFKRTSPNRFIGAKSMSLNGGVAVPLDGGLGHWANGTVDDVTSPFTILNQETAMDPSILSGTRKYFTELDYAGMGDIGWDVIPEPSTALMLSFGTVAVCARRRRGSFASGI